MGGWLLASICMYEMFPSYLGQSGGSLSNAQRTHVGLLLLNILVTGHSNQNSFG